MAPPDRGHRKKTGDASAAGTALANRCAQELMEAMPLVMRAIRNEIRRQGAAHFSVPQIRTLAFLHHRPGAYLFELAEHLGVARPTASTLVERLVQRRMVTRTPDPGERRRVMLALTPLGTRHFQNASHTAQAWIATVLAAQRPSVLRRLTAAMSVLAKAFEGSANGGGRRPSLTHRADLGILARRGTWKDGANSSISGR
jgi:DNA-binding MarR family transcriptional regulator